MEQSKPLNTHKTKESTELFACLNQAGKSVAYKSSGMANTTVYLTFEVQIAKIFRRIDSDRFIFCKTKANSITIL